jgi:flagellar motor protein MotB
MTNQDLMNTFAEENGITSQGRLGLMLCVTRNFIEDGLPQDFAEMLTDGGGQIRKVSGSRASKVLKEHGIKRALATEGGRTSRGSIGIARAYWDLLQRESITQLDSLKEIESWWVERVAMYFAQEPFEFKYDPSKSFRSIIRDLLDQATKRQKTDTGTMYCGIMLEHLVGAKLELISGHTIEHHKSSTADQHATRDGDFELGDVTIHVTTSPSEHLIEKCRRNLERKRRPLIVTLASSIGHADNLCRLNDIEGRVEVFDAEQFLVSNFYEHGAFKTHESVVTAENVIDRYNEIIEELQEMPSLKIKRG